MNIFQFNGGHNFSLNDGPDNLINYSGISNIVALVPPRISRFKSKVIVKINDQVLKGQILFYSKKNKTVKFTSPSSGIIHNILYGKKRSLKAIEIKIDHNNNNYIKFSKTNIEKLNKSIIVENLINSGIWSKLKTFPNLSFIENKNKLIEENATLFVSLFSTEPHMANIKLLLENKNWPPTLEQFKNIATFAFKESKEKKFTVLVYWKNDPNLIIFDPKFYAKTKYVSNGFVSNGRIVEVHIGKKQVKH